MKLLILKGNGTLEIIKMVNGVQGACVTCYWDTLVHGLSPNPGKKDRDYIRKD
jgi:hypothetical protein